MQPWPHAFLSVGTRRIFVAGFLLCVLSAFGCSLSKPKLPDDLGPGANVPVVRTALSQVGVPYRSGGESPSEGFDCSGLIVWTYAQYGVKLPRTAAEQARVGRAVGKAAMQPGDIVCFNIGRKARHTGLYVGRSYFVHSPSSGKTVTVESLETEYWKKRFAGARRPVQRVGT